MFAADIIIIADLVFYSPLVFLLLFSPTHQFLETDFSAPAQSSFDYFVFAQSWLPSECLVSNEEQPGSCQIPPHVYRWTIHGLWPSSSDAREGPEFCPVPGRHFNVSLIKSLIPLLKVEWPNVIPDRSPDSLWKHEWEKHGSCATQVKSLPDESAYFKQGLLIHDSYNLIVILSSVDIYPSDEKLYASKIIFDHLKSTLNDSFSLHCVKSREDNKWYLSEFRLCIDKMFRLIHCPKMSSLGGMPTPTHCPPDDMLAYPTLHSLAEKMKKNGKIVDQSCSLTNFFANMYFVR